MNIGEASKASRISAKMIRYYEQIGLIPPAHRSESGYRVYGGSDIQRLHFIRRARDFGFSAYEIKDLLDLWTDPSRRSADVKRMAEHHIAALDRRIDDMRQMASSLKTLTGSCAGDQSPDCSILQGLQQPDDGRTGPLPRTGAVPRPSRSHGGGPACEGDDQCVCPH
ncbi:Copper export regulator [Delftia tsuruhatensis]|uniref:Cu(I)-responsive transcriptional regulator n=1 Tax=Delftia tsuruhatensis TaxID=180282 RepID=UPI001E73497F|nr:Cu(I)-responsive transcriptional regulator [Delftia tsuruhatensis]CAB5716583.1 Copper export regulator [Delftia tsuruhatensis]CAC9685926.1 Copper export regulator [Delftia tsuruhatensis]